MSKTQKHQEHSILSTNLHQGINWTVKHNNLVIIIVKAELQYSKQPKINKLQFDPLRIPIHVHSNPITINSSLTSKRAHVCSLAVIMVSLVVS